MMLDVMTNAQVTEQKQAISMPRLLLHLEGLAVLLGAVVLYGHVSGDWLAFIVLFYRLLGQGLVSRAGMPAIAGFHP